MTGKVVHGDGMIFEDDIKIDEQEVSDRLKLPEPLPVFDKDELLILYNGHILVPKKGKSPLGEIKIYTEKFGLAEAESPNQLEQEYFTKNASAIDALETDFLERAIGKEAASSKSSLTDVVRGLIGEMLTKQYKQSNQMNLPGRGIIPHLEDGSVLNNYVGLIDSVMVLGSKLYTLLTLPQYIRQFEPGVEPAFFKKLLKQAETGTPEDVYELITQNKDKVGQRERTMMNRIWYSHRSSTILLDGVYWIPEHLGDTSKTIASYYNALEGEIKRRAINGGGHKK